MSEEAPNQAPPATEAEAAASASKDGGGDEEPESKRLKTSDGAADAAPPEVHPDEEEDAAKAGGDAIPTSPINVSPNRSQRNSAHSSDHEIEAPPPPKPPAPADWRETLFVWRGVLEYNPTKRRCNWLGSWAPQVSHADGPPTDRDFETHQENSFVLHRVLDKRIDLGRATTIPDVLYGRSLSWLGFYKLDQDDGKGRQRLVDFSHQFMVQPVERDAADESSPGGRILGAVGAVGSNEFGNFVSVGLITEESKDDAEGSDAGTESKLTLTLARRYITNKDGRNRWKTPKEAMKGLDLDGVVKTGDFWAAVPTKEAEGAEE